MSEFVDSKYGRNIALMAIVLLSLGIVVFAFGLFDSKTEVQAILKLDPVDSKSPAYLQTQCQLLKSGFVVKSALTRPDIAKLSIVQAESDGMRWNGMQWLQDALETKVSPDSTFITISLRADAPADELRQILDAVIDAFQEEVIVSERVARAEKEMESKMLRFQLETEYKELIARQSKLQKQSKDKDFDPSELGLLDVRIKALGSHLEDVLKKASEQEFASTISDYPLKVLQDATEVK